ncbi:glycosyltransferase family 2 protein [Paenibacillus tundrae]|uniref:glycosyltransferase family 2 protein n=1 Tax=Paenibacillus tundrae TaxID=528187 RepID=UPI0022A986F1|nr:glycosyltransferase family 2 protein [Paenibacillus tundrae]MCZ1264752.1 glycosyltransferase family 2 protein [Paenibacillus tundrae]
MFKKMSISIVITTKNKAEYLDMTLYCLILQTYRNFEVIIVDDGSLDRTEDVVEKWSKLLLNPIKYIKNITSMGAGSARNIALKEVNSDYVLFLDDDRLLDVNGVGEHVRANSDHPNSFICGNRWELYSGMTKSSRDFLYKIIDERQLIRYRKHIEPMPRVMSKAFEELGQEWPLKWFLILTGNLSVPMSILDKLNGFDGSLERLEDLEMGYRAYDLGCDIRFTVSIESYHLAHPRDHYNVIMTKVYRKLKSKHSGSHMQFLEPFLTGEICLHEYEQLVNPYSVNNLKCDCKNDGESARVLYFINNNSRK